MKTISFLFASLLFVCHLMSQSIYDFPNVQTTVSVDTLVLPNEIILQFSISGSKDDFAKKKYEENILKHLEEIDPILSENFKLVNLHANTFRILFITSSKKQNRSYRIKVNSFKQMESVFELLQNIGIKEIRIEEFNISNKTEILNQLRTNAIKAAESQALSLLDGQAQKIGKILEIKDLENEDDYFLNSITTGHLNSINFKVKEEQESINFENIKLQKRIEIRFKIE